MKLNFTVLGEAVAKQSARFCNMGGYIKSYQKKSVTDYANYVRMCFLEKYPDHQIAETKDKMLEIRIDYYKVIPKSKSKKFTERAIQLQERPITKPDTDNIAKNIKDALNKTAYYDDSQIVSETINKFYSETPRVEIYIGTIENA